MTQTEYETLRDLWWTSYTKALGDYQKQEFAANRIISAFVQALGVPESCWRYVNRDGTREPGTSHSFVAATTPQNGGWTTTCFSITFERSPQAYPKQDITIRLWLRAADSGWELRLYEDDMAKLLDQNEEPLGPIKDRFVDEIGFVLKALTLWPPSTEPKKAIGFRSDRVDGAGA